MQENDSRFLQTLRQISCANKRKNIRLNLEQPGTSRDKSQFVARDSQHFRDYARHTYFHGRDVHAWLACHRRTTHPDYLYQPKEKRHCLKIKRIFEKFDRDNSQTLELQEFLQMFNEYYLESIPLTFGRELPHQDRACRPPERLHHPLRFRHPRRPPDPRTVRPPRHPPRRQRLLPRLHAQRSVTSCVPDSTPSPTPTPRSSCPPPSTA